MTLLDAEAGPPEALGRNEVHVWVVEPASIVDPRTLRALEELMSPDEREKQRAFARDELRRESLVTRGLVRTALSRYRATAPGQWRFRSNEYGRPEIDPPCGLRFNLSNHPELVVCAVCEDADVGIDAEPVDRGVEILEIAPLLFARSELAELERLAPPARVERAVLLWTLKEALIKAKGRGLSLPLDAVAFTFPPEEPPTVTFAETVDDDASRWAFRTMQVGAFRLALAVDTRGAAPLIRLRR